MPKAKDIGDKAVDIIRALNLTPTPDVQSRKNPTLPAGKSPPAIAVSVGEEGDAEYIEAGWVLIKYPVAVAIYTAAPGATQDESTVLSWRAAIRPAIDNPAAWAAITGFNDVTTRGKAPFNRAALEKLFNCSIQVFFVEVKEARS